MANGMNIQIVAGKAKSVNVRDVRDKKLTTIRVEGFPFSILVWDEVEAKEGDFLFAQGRVQSRSYEKDSVKKYVTEIIAYRVTNLSTDKAGNVAFAVGNLGKDPSMRYTSDGKAVTDVSMAASTFGSETPEWFSLTAWEKVAEVINEYMHKGDRIAVAGRLTKDTWQGKGEHEGKSFHRTKLVVNDMLMLGGRRENGNGEPALEPPPDMEDVPF